MNTTTYNNTFANETDFMPQKSNGSFLLLAITSINLMVSTLCLLYISLRLKLNKFIKVILCIMAIQNIVCASIMTITNATMIILDEKSFLTCNILTQIVLVFTRSNSMMPSFISILRYAMAWKASYAKFLKEKYIICAIIFCAIIPYLNLSFNFMLNRGYGELASLCLDLHNDRLQVLQVQWIINGSLHFLSLGSGIFFDFKMLLFVRNRNKTQPVELVPWKSASPKRKDEDMNVPLKGTIISSMFFFSALIVYYAIFSSDNVWSILCMISAYYIVPLPFLLIFTIKQKSSEKSVVQPPQTLQFHNEDIVDEEMNTNTHTLRQLNASELLKSTS